MKDQLTKHIELTQSKNGHHKTVLYSENPLLYNVVTKVNYMTTLLWVEFINQLIKNTPDCKIEPFTKINWMVLNKHYRRDIHKRILNPK